MILNKSKHLAGGVSQFELVNVIRTNRTAVHLLPLQQRCQVARLRPHRQHVLNSDGVEQFRDVNLIIFDFTIPSTSRWR